MASKIFQPAILLVLVSQAALASVLCNTGISRFTNKTFGSKTCLQLLMREGLPSSSTLHSDTRIFCQTVTSVGLVIHIFMIVLCVAVSSPFFQFWIFSSCLLLVLFYASSKANVAEVNVVKSESYHFQHNILRQKKQSCQ